MPEHKKYYTCYQGIFYRYDPVNDIWYLSDCNNGAQCEMMFSGKTHRIDQCIEIFKEEIKLWQIDAAYRTKIGNLTVEEIEKSLRQLWPTEADFNKSMHGSELPIGLLSPEALAQKKRVLGNFAFSGLGDEVYHIGGGCLTGKGGWEMFNNLLKQRMEHGQ